MTNERVVKELAKKPGILTYETQSMKNLRYPGSKSTGAHINELQAPTHRIALNIYLYLHWQRCLTPSHPEGFFFKKAAVLSQQSHL